MKFLFIIELNEKIKNIDYFMILMIIFLHQIFLTTTTLITLFKIRKKHIFK